MHPAPLLAGIMFRLDPFDMVADPTQYSKVATQTSDFEGLLIADMSTRCIRASIAIWSLIILHFVETDHGTEIRAVGSYGTSWITRALSAVSSPRTYPPLRFER